jgi:hypothetical protein
MGISFSYGIVALNNYNSRNNSRNSNNEYKLIKNDILDKEIEIKKIKFEKNKNYNNING